MSNQPPVSDFSRLDAHMASVRRVALLNASWKFALAGAAGATAIIGAVVVGAWVGGPRFSYRTVEIPHIVERDVLLNNPIPHDVPFEVPRIVETSPEPSAIAPRSPAESKLVTSPEWVGAVIKGRIMRATQNGFALQTPSGAEEDFYPAKINSNGTVEPDPTMRDDVSRLLGRLALCRQLPTSVFECLSLGADGRMTRIPEVPIAGEPT